MPTIKDRARCAKCHRRLIVSRDLTPVKFSEYFRITYRWSYRLHYVCRDAAACEAYKLKKLNEKRAQMAKIIAPVL